ncbi:hypothetical protein SK128_011787, partial [Halocaridina rubra]
VSEAKGREKGCQVLTMQATNPITAIIAQKLDYETLRRMDVRSFRGADGQCLLDTSAMAGTTHFVFLSKKLIH